MQAMEPNADKIDCYGKRIDCPRRADCELGSPCFNRARESADDLHYQYQHVSVPQMEYDPCEDREHETDQVAKAYYEAAVESDDPSPLELDGISIPPDVLPVVYKVLEKIAEYYIHTPHVFDALINTVMRGKTQSDIAREKHITRQCVNKRLLRELGIAQKRNDIQARRDRELHEKKREYDARLDDMRRRDEFLSSLSERDWRVYKLVFVDGVSYESAARTLECSKRTIIRVSLFLRSKLNGNVTVSIGRRPKNPKK